MFAPSINYDSTELVEFFSITALLIGYLVGFRACANRTAQKRNDRGLSAFTL